MTEICSLALKQLGYDELITNNYKTLDVPEEVAAIVKTKAVVIAVEALGHDQRAVGALLLELPHLADRVRPGTSNVFRLKYLRRQPDDGWKYFAASAARLQRTTHDLWPLFAAMLVFDIGLAIYQSGQPAAAYLNQCILLCTTGHVLVGLGIRAENLTFGLSVSPRAIVLLSRLTASHW